MQNWIDDNELCVLNLTSYNNKVLQDKKKTETRENKHESRIKLKKEEIDLKEGKNWSSPQRDKQTNTNINININEQKRTIIRSG